MFLNCGAGEDSWEVPVHPKGNQSWIFIGRTGAEAEAPILWPPDVKNWLTGKDPDAGKDWGQEEKGAREEEIVGRHHWLSGHGFGWTPGVGDGQGGLACCGSWGLKELDTTEWQNWTEPNKDFPGGSDSKSVCLQCRRPEFDPGVRKIPWRRKWQPTPVFLSGKSHGQRSLVGYSPWGSQSQTALSNWTANNTDCAGTPLTHSKVSDKSIDS